MALHSYIGILFCRAPSNLRLFLFLLGCIEIAAIERGSRTRNVAIDPAKSECANGEPRKVGAKPGGIRGKCE
jgi:hypothetical protein